MPSESRSGVWAPRSRLVARRALRPAADEWEQSFTLNGCAVFLY